MRSLFATLRSLTLPAGAGSGTPRTVIGPNIPAELVAYYPGEVLGGVVSYSSDGSYTYDMAILLPLGPPPPVGHARGIVTAGGVVLETLLEIWPTATSARLYLGGLDLSVGVTTENVIDTHSSLTMAVGDNLTVTTAITVATYTPVLTANTTNPTLGTGAIVQGRYTRDPWTGWADVNIRFRFGTAGVAAGSGTYNIELPFAISLLNDPNDAIRGRSDQLGMGTLRDNSVPTSTDVIVLAKNAAGGPNGFGQVQLLVVGGGAFVGAAAPWTWAAQDEIDITVRCRTA